MNPYATLADRYKLYAPDPELHGSYYPADIYPGESIYTTIRNAQTGELLEANARAWRLSPLGLEVVTKRSREGLVGVPIDVEMRVGREAFHVTGIIVASHGSQHGEPLLGIRLVELDGHATYEGPDRRDGSRWLFGDQFCPICVAANPARFNDFVYLRVRDVSSRGMRLTTSLRNKFLIQGMTLRCLVSLPLVAQLSLNLTIKNIELENDPDNPLLAIGASFDSASQSDLQLLGQYIVQFGQGAQLDELRAYGLVPKSVSSAVEFSFARTIHEYEQVLRLRHIAYTQAGKVGTSLTPQDMGETYDTRSRIVIAKYHGKVIASAGLVFNEYHDKMEIEDSTVWPSGLPRREEMVEVIRNCTHPSYRGNDLLMAMFRFIAITVLQAGRKYVVIGTTPDLVALYSRIGMHDVNLEYNHGKLGGALHKVMLGDIPKTMAGVGISPIYWNALWADTATYMHTNELVSPTGLDLIRTRAYGILRPLSLLLQARMQRTRRHRQKA